MSFFNEINQKYKIYVYGEAATERSIQNLKNFSAVPIPEEYFEIIREKSELEINLKENTYLRIWGADWCLKVNPAYHVQRYISNGIAIGDEEGAYMLLYANGKKGFGLYLADFGNLDKDELIYVSKSLKDLLLKGIGINVIVNVYEIKPK